MDNQSDAQTVVSNASSGYQIPSSLINYKNMRHYEVTDFIYRKENKGYLKKIETEKEIEYLTMNPVKPIELDSNDRKITPKQYARDNIQTRDYNTWRDVGKTEGSVFQKYKSRLIRPATVARVAVRRKLKRAETENTNYLDEVRMTPKVTQEESRTPSPIEFHQPRSTTSQQPRSTSHAPRSLSPQQPRSATPTLKYTRAPSQQQPRSTTSHAPRSLSPQQPRSATPTLKYTRALTTPQPPANNTFDTGRPQTGIKPGVQPVRRIIITPGNSKISKVSEVTYAQKAREQIQEQYEALQSLTSQGRDSVSMGQFPTLSTNRIYATQRRHGLLFSRKGSKKLTRVINEENASITSVQSINTFKNKLETIIDKCAEQENSAQEVIKLVDKIKNIDNAIYKQFKTTVDILQDLDYADARTIPALFNQKMEDKMNVKVAAMQVSRDYKLGIADPFRTVAKIERMRRRNR